MEIPNAYIIRIHPNRHDPRAVIVTVQCPHCYKEHHHGGSVEEFPHRFGHRSAHCINRTNQDSPAGPAGLTYEIRWPEARPTS